MSSISININKLFYIKNKNKNLNKLYRIKIKNFNKIIFKYIYLNIFYLIF